MSKFKKILSRGALPPEPPVYIYCAYYLFILAFKTRNHTFLPAILPL